MKVKTVTYSVGATFATAQFENVRPEYSMTVELEDGENPQAVFKKIKSFCDGLINIDAADVKGK